MRVLWQKLCTILKKYQKNTKIGITLYKYVVLYKSKFMNAKETLNKIKVALGMEVQFEQAKLDNGTVIEADAFEAGQGVFIVVEEDKVPLPIGEYAMEDGKILVVAEEGIIAEIKDSEEKSEEKSEEVSEDVSEAPAEVEASEENSAPKKIVESITKEMFFAEIEKLRAEIEELKNLEEAPKKELLKAADEFNAELSDQKSEEPKEEAEIALSEEVTEVAEEVKHSPEAELKREQKLFSQKRPSTTRDRVFAKLFN